MLDELRRQRRRQWRLCCGLFDRIRSVTTHLCPTPLVSPHRAQTTFRGYACMHVVAIPPPLPTDRLALRACITQTDTRASAHAHAHVKFFGKLLYLLRSALAADAVAGVLDSLAHKWRMFTQTAPRDATPPTPSSRARSHAVAQFSHTHTPPPSETQVVGIASACVREPLSPHRTAHIIHPGPVGAAVHVHGSLQQQRRRQQQCTLKKL